MIILTIKTDQKIAEIGLYDIQKKLDYLAWEAHRNLSKDIHIKIEEILKKNDRGYQDLNGVVCFSGPGSFTGLRIGVSVVNALASSLNIPVISKNSKDWIKDGISDLLEDNGKTAIFPDYGMPAKTTKPKK